ncbi:MAG: hypothetical protein U1F54_18795 [Burkholderiales bacterium]
MTVAFFPLHADDAYIVARYAEQLHAGHGPVFNKGEAVNALTSPAHFGTLVALRSVADDPVTIYRALCSVLVAAVLISIAHLRWPHDLRGAYFLALTLACPFVAFWTVGGLETPLLLSLCTIIAYLSTQAGPRSAAAIVGLSAVAVLVRYDAVLFVAPVAMVAIWRHRIDVRVWLAFTVGCLAVLAWLMFTWVFYGDILPTSFYVKAGSAPALSELVRGLLYVTSFAALTWIWIAVLLFRGADFASVRPVWVGLFLTSTYAVFASTKHMMYCYRLLVPFLPVLAFALLHGIREVPSRGRRAMLATVLIAQASLAAFVYYWSQNPSLSLIAEGRSDANAAFEFSHLGARHTGAFLATAEGQANAIRNHWAAADLGVTRPPRIIVSTGGRLPFLLPDAYVFEQLVSYRHECKPALEPLADYSQVIYDANESTEVARQRVLQGREVVARFELEASGLRAEPLPLVIEIWYRAAEAPNPLPPRLSGQCR